MTWDEIKEEVDLHLNSRCWIGWTVEIVPPDNESDIARMTVKLEERRNKPFRWSCAVRKNDSGESWEFEAREDDWNSIYELWEILFWRLYEEHNAN